MNKNIIAFPIIVIAITIYPYFISPLWNDIQSLAQQKEFLNQTIKKAEEFVIVRDNLLDKKKQFSDLELSRVDILLPSDADEVQIILDIQQLALRNGLVINSISAEKEETTELEPYSLLSVNLSFSGSYGQLKTFLTTLSESLMLFEVSSLSFGRPDEGTSITEFSVEMTTSTYNK